MTPHAIHYHVFETAAGFAAVGWGAAGIMSVRLPAPTFAQAERAVLRRLPESIPAEPPSAVAEVVDAACRYFRGERIDFASVPLDIGAQEPFFARVYDVVRKLGWGETMTYGAVAKALGEGPEAARAVGQAMASNPVPLIIPCHRVTAAGGRIGGFSAPGGSVSKARMLELEGAAPPPAPEAAQIGFGF